MHRPSYPQGLVVPETGMFVVAFSNNKEDIWVVQVPVDQLLHH